MGLFLVLKMKINFIFTQYTHKESERFDYAFMEEEVMQWQVLGLGGGGEDENSRMGWGLGV